MTLFKRHRVYAKKYLDKYYVKINGDFQLTFYVDEKLLSKYKKDIEEGKSKFVTFLDKQDKIKYTGVTILREDIRTIDWSQQEEIFCEYYRTPEEMISKEKELKEKGWIIHE